MTYNSQFGQDKYLEENVFKRFKNGIFMDIGAHDGVTLNNTLYFEENNNWTGYNIEPINEIYNKLIINRPKCINIKCAVNTDIGEDEFIYNKGYSEMISGLKKYYEDEHMIRLKQELNQFGGSTDVIKVNTRTVESICDEYDIKRIHYLSIDVEGAEYQVIKSINFDKVFIDVIEFENNYEKNTETPIIQYLNERGYKMIHKLGPDIFMIHKNSIFNT